MEKDKWQTFLNQILFSFVGTPVVTKVDIWPLVRSPRWGCGYYYTLTYLAVGIPGVKQTGLLTTLWSQTVGYGNVWSHQTVLFFLYILLIILTFVLLFPPLSLSTKHPHSLRQSLRDCSCPQVMHISSLAIPFPILYLTSPWLFCNYIFILLNHLTSHPLSSSPLPSGNYLVTNFFSLAAFKSLSLSLTFGLLIMMCLGVGLFASIIIGTLCASWICMSISFTK